VQFHYALVDDLLTREEFDRKVEEKIQSLGDLIDELTAAILIVEECGRHHVKISGLSAKSSLFSFFGKVIGKNPPREFIRKDGEKSMVASLIVGDETGQATVVLWDEKAMALEEIACGEVLEIIGRHPGKPSRDIYALALRKVDCEISCDATPVKTSPPERRSASVLLIALEEPRTYTRRDGTTREMISALIGDGAGTIRLVAWAPELLAGFGPGDCIRIENALVKPRDQGREYQIDEKSTITRSDEPIAFSFSPLSSVKNEGIYSVRGVIRRIEPPRSFMSKNQGRSYVRNLAITDESGEIPVVVWGERAMQQLIPGDELTLYHASAKPGRSGGTELHVNWGSVLELTPADNEKPVNVEGTVIVTREGTYIDNGTTWYLAGSDLPHGREVRVEGVVSGRRLTVMRYEALDMDPADSIRQIDLLVLELEREPR
jgi:replication factor A1